MGATAQLLKNCNFTTNVEQAFGNRKPPVNIFQNSNFAATASAVAAAPPALEIVEGRYVARFARTPEEIDAVLRLRYDVFNLELGEGLETSHITGRDEDEFDRICHHLIVADKKTGAIVGTYRLLTFEMARTPFGFYSAAEFEIEDFPPEVLRASLELGRACIAREHRHTRVLFLLWKGLAAYSAMNDKRYLFGCCSLTTQNCAEGLKAARLIEREGNFHPRYLISQRKNYFCETRNFSVEPAADKDFQLPKLFLTYLRFGAKVCSPPAIDRHFKTIDFLVLFDVASIDEKYRRMLFRYS